MGLHGIYAKCDYSNYCSAVVESYEKAIAELVGEREQMRNANEAMKQDRDANFEHLTSLETTFSDLHT